MKILYYLLFFLLLSGCAVTTKTTTFEALRDDELVQVAQITTSGVSEASFTDKGETYSTNSKSPSLIKTVLEATAMRKINKETN